MPAALAAEALPLIAEAVALVEVLSKTTWARLVVAAREANFTGSALLMTTFTMTMTTGSAWWARSLTTTAITTTGPIAGSRSASTPELDGVGTAFGPATRLRLLRTERPTRRFLCSNVSMGLGTDVTGPIEFVCFVP